MNPQTPESYRHDAARERVESSAPEGPVLRRFADIEPKPIHWLWPDRLALGKLTVIAGDPGLGKSFLTLDIAARVSTGLEWPDGASAFGECADVLLVSAEDDPDDTIRPRLDALHADVNRVHVFDGFRTSQGGPIRDWTLVDVDALRRVINEVDNCRLVVVDPVTAFYAGRDDHRAAEVRGLLKPLAQLASETGVALVVVSHLNKSPGGRAVSRITGSLALPAAARSVWLVTKHPTDTNRRVFACVKSNISTPQSALAFEINGDPPRVVWGETCDFDADELLAAGVETTDIGAVAQAEEFLRYTLASGPVPTREVEAAAREEGISKAALTRARKSLGVLPDKRGNGGWMLQLPTNPNTRTESS